MTREQQKKLKGLKSALPKIIQSEIKKYKLWEIDELEKYVIKYIEHFYQSTQSFGIEKFYECMNASSYHQELRKPLSLIYEKKYKEALDYLNTQGRSHFCNKGVWVNDAMRDYISHAT